jgi:hypothetical protein
MTGAVSNFFRINPIDPKNASSEDAKAQKDRFESIPLFIGADPTADVQIGGDNFHMVNGNRLPIPEFFFSNGATCIISGDFKKYTVTVFGSEPLDVSLLRDLGLKTETKEISCEGFPNDMVFGSYEENPGTFTTVAENDKALWYLLGHLKQVNNPAPEPSQTGLLWNFNS